MSTNDSQRGYSIDTGRRRKKQLGLGILAVVIVAIVVVIVVNATGGNSANASEFGTNMKIAYFSAFPSEEKLLEYVAKEVAPEYGLTVTPVSLGEPQQIDRSVSEGENAATIYEHKYWMQQEVESGGFNIEAALPIYKWAFALDSDKYKSVAELPQGATIAIPADPSNQAQALWLLESQGLVKLKAGVNAWSAELGDIEENPKDLKFKAIEATDVPRALGDVDAAVTYADIFETAGVSADKTIVIPVPPPPFDSQLVIGKAHADDPNIKKLIELWEDPKIQAYLKNEGAPALFPVSAKPTIGPNA
ncbi:MAG TPA: MetQ/NlpA family ABC transporter substrate-binding protein [Solirubrobacterales bacterium]|nr:MetQ/NlpA family ABC transporter substrate-binding protein [Solirubrobacterales bacterium]